MDISTTLPARKLDALTSLRFGAAAGIVLYHCGGSFGLPTDMSFGERIPLGLGVSFFFVLSGFILTYVYPRLGSPSSCGRFLLARFARIWPCHIFALAVFFLLNRVTVTSIKENGLVIPYLANLAMIHSWVPVNSFCLSGNPPSWTIATEFGFYLLFPLLIWRLDRTWHVKLAACLLLAIGSIAACQFGVVADESVNGLLYMSPLCRLFEFSLGMTTAHCFRIVAPRVRLGRLWSTLVEVAAFALVVVNAYFWSDIVDWALIRSGMSPKVRMWFLHGSTCLSFALLIFVAALSRGWITRALAWRGFVLLGEISYAVYLLHVPLLGYASTYAWAFGETPNWAVFAYFVAFLLAASHITWALIECPARQFLVGLWPRSTAGLVAFGPAPTRRRYWRVPSPARFILAAELLVVGSFVFAVERRPSHIQFGDRYLLRSVLLRPTELGLNVGLMWESRRKQPLDCYVAVHLCDRKGKVLADFSYVQESRQRTVAEKMIWRENHVIPYHNITETTGHEMTSLAIGIGPISPEQAPLYHPNHGPRDAGNWRVLLELDAFARTDPSPQAPRKYDPTPVDVWRISNYPM